MTVLKMFSSEVRTNIEYKNISAFHAQVLSTFSKVNPQIIPATVKEQV